MSIAFLGPVGEIVSLLPHQLIFPQNMETIEPDVEPMSSPVISPSKKHKEHRERGQPSRYLYFFLIIAFAIGTNQPMTFGTGFIRHGGGISRILK